MSKVNHSPSNWGIDKLKSYVEKYDLKSKIVSTGKRGSLKKDYVKVVREHLKIPKTLCQYCHVPFLLSADVDVYCHQCDTVVHDCCSEECFMANTHYMTDACTDDYEHVCMLCYEVATTEKMGSCADYCRLCKILN